MTNKLFAKFDLGFVDNPKIIGLSDAAFRAYVEGIVYARQHLTDGFLDFRVVARKWGAEVVEELTTNDPTNPSWKPAKNGFEIHDFAVHQTTKADIQDIREARSAAGKRGAEAKLKQTVSKSEANENVLLSKSKPETETETETVNLTPNPQDLFDSFWDEYPRRVGKESARKAFLKAMKRSVPSEIIAGAVRLAQDPNLPDMQFVPHPATWLNRDGWDDEPYPAKPAPAGFVTPSMPQPPKLSDIYCEKHYGYPRNNCDRCREDI